MPAGTSATRHQPPTTADLGHQAHTGGFGPTTRTTEPWVGGRPVLVNRQPDLLMRRWLFSFEPEQWAEVGSRGDVLAAFELWVEARADYGRQHGITVSAYVEE